VSQLSWTSERLEVASKIIEIAVRKRAIKQPCLQADDLRGVGWEAAAKALLSFDESRGMKWTSYLTWRINLGIIDYQRSLNQYRKNRPRYWVSSRVFVDSPQDPVKQGAVKNESTWWIMVPPVQPNGAESRVDVENVCKMVDDRAAYILLRIAEGATQEAIAQEMGITSARVSQIKFEAFKRIRRLDSITINHKKNGKSYRPSISVGPPNSGSSLCGEDDDSGTQALARSDV
jgi:RNA polymerase sigma factor (sigma-70 family)